jgi:acyl-CoA synthetase (AMP-forming)/AMP-acid ligase II
LSETWQATRLRKANELPTTVGAVLRRSLAADPAHDAIATRAETLSYQTLDERSATMARALVAIGAGKGTRIALLAPDGILWLTTFLAAMRIGAVVAPLSTLCTAPELAYLLRHCDAQIFIGVRRFLRHEYAKRMSAALPGLANSRGQLRLTNAPFLRSIWLDDATGADWAGSLAALLGRAAAPDAPDAGLLAAMENEVVPSDDAVIIYTSGSTSLPKAVLHTQRSVAHHPQILGEHFCIKATDRMMPLLPLFWIGGLAMALEVLQAGATLLYPESPALDTVCDSLITLRANRVNTWGPQLARLRAAVAARGIDVESIGGLAQLREPNGKPIPPERAANMLGMTESFGPHSSEPLDTVLPAHRAGSSGRATSDYERRVVDPASGEVLGPGRSGELQLRGGGLMKGFYKVDPRQVFTPDGFYPTGDIVRIEEDGHLFFEGRRGDMLKTAGANVSRLEVEAALRALPEVALPIVVGLPDAEIGQLVVAAVVPAEGSAPTEASLQAALRERLSSYKVPRRILVIAPDEVLWTPSNKIRLADMAQLIATRLAPGS